MLAGIEINKKSLESWMFSEERAMRFFVLSQWSPVKIVSYIVQFQPLHQF